VQTLAIMGSVPNPFKQSFSNGFKESFSNTDRVKSLFGIEEFRSDI
jgi:hypothetical protein